MHLSPLVASAASIQSIGSLVNSLFIVALIVCGGFVLGPCTWCPSKFCNHLAAEDMTGCPSQVNCIKSHLHKVGVNIIKLTV